MPGTELAFNGKVARMSTGLFGWKMRTITHQTAIFRQVNKDKPAAHHDALEFPDGRTVLLTLRAPPAASAASLSRARETYEHAS
jgi:hypothetical protein